MVVPLQEFLIVIVGSVVLSLVLLAALWPWMRKFRRLLLIGTACAVAIIAWDVALNLTNATTLNVDSDLLGLSFQDIGSGVLAFCAGLVALAPGDGWQPKRVLGASAIVGLLTILVDRYA
jgi:hypothetical protein